MTPERLAVLLLWIAAIFDPIGNVFYFRYVAIGFAMIVLLSSFVWGRVDGAVFAVRSAFILVFALILPLYGSLLYSINSGSQPFIDTSYIAAGALALTALLYSSARDCEYGINVLLGCIRALSIVILAGFLSDLLANADWLSFFTQRNVALVSVREYAGVTLPYIYFLASPLLILLVGNDLSKLKSRPLCIGWPLFLTSTVALALSGTRAHILVAVLFVPLYMVLAGEIKKVLLAILGGAGLLLCASIFVDVWGLLLAFLSTEETSNSMKLALLDGYLEIFSEPFMLLVGQGFNAHEWSSTLRGMIAMDEGASKTELTYLELMRVFGLGGMVLVCGCLTWILFRLKELPGALKWIFPSLTIYLLNASLNPYLFSTNGILPLSLFVSISLYFCPNSDALRKQSEACVSLASGLKANN